MNWTVLVAKAAQSQLLKLPARDRTRIAVALVEMRTDPFSGDIRKLEGAHNSWRRRTGEYRIFFSVDRRARTVTVSAIFRRTSTTY